jgi:hypothetical protein
MRALFLSLSSYVPATSVGDILLTFAEASVLVRVGLAVVLTQDVFLVVTLLTTWKRKDHPSALNQGPTAPCGCRHSVSTGKKPTGSSAQLAYRLTTSPGTRRGAAHDQTIDGQTHGRLMSSLREQTSQSLQRYPRPYIALFLQHESHGQQSTISASGNGSRGLPWKRRQWAALLMAQHVSGTSAEDKVDQGRRGKVLRGSVPYPSPTAITR